MPPANSSYTLNAALAIGSDHDAASPGHSNDGEGSTESRLAPGMRNSCDESNSRRKPIEPTQWKGFGRRNQRRNGLQCAGRSAVQDDSSPGKRER